MKSPEVVDFPHSVNQHGHPRRVSKTYRLISTYVSFLDEIMKANGLKNHRDALEFCIETTRKAARVEAVSMQVPIARSVVKLSGWSTPKGFAVAAEGPGLALLALDKKRAQIAQVMNSASVVLKERNGRRTNGERKKRG